MKVEQLSMFPPEWRDWLEENKQVHESIWYYVCRRDPPYRTLYTDTEGRFYLAERDLLRVVPALFNLAREAKRVASQFDCIVKRYPYKIG